MIISLSYRVGKDSQQKHFEDFKEMVSFLKKCVDVLQSDFQTYEITTHLGEEEKRVRKLFANPILGEQK